MSTYTTPVDKESGVVSQWMLMRSKGRIQELSRFRDKVGVPAVLGAIVDANGELDLKVVGIRRRDHPETVAASDCTHIGSCCKMITAALFGTFVAEQRVAWEMPVTDLFPELTDSIAEGWQQRTVEELFFV